MGQWICRLGSMSQDREGGSGSNKNIYPIFLDSKSFPDILRLLKCAIYSFLNAGKFVLFPSL